MTREDMLEYGIDSGDADYENPSTRRAFWRVLDVARESCGFDVTGDKILVQFYPSGEGSEMFVTRLGRIGAGAERSISRSQNVAMLSSRHTVYKFSDLSSLIKLSRGFRAEGRETPAELYFSDDGYFYLVFEARGALGSLCELDSLCEFASEVPYTLEPYIIEHSKKISEGGNAFLAMASL